MIAAFCKRFSCAGAKYGSYFYRAMGEVTGAQLIAESLKAQVRPVKNTNFAKFPAVCVFSKRTIVTHLLRVKVHVLRRQVVNI